MRRSSRHPRLDQHLDDDPDSTSGPKTADGIGDTTALFVNELQAQDTSTSVDRPSFFVFSLPEAPWLIHIPSR